MNYLQEIWTMIAFGVLVIQKSFFVIFCRFFVSIMNLVFTFFAFRIVKRRRQTFNYASCPPILPDFSDHVTEIYLKQSYVIMPRFMFLASCAHCVTSVTKSQVEHESLLHPLQGLFSGLLSKEIFKRPESRLS